MTRRRSFLRLHHRKSDKETFSCRIIHIRTNIGKLITILSRYLPSSSSLGPQSSTSRRNRLQLYAEAVPRSTGMHRCSASPSSLPPRRCKALDSYTKRFNARSRDHRLGLREFQDVRRLRARTRLVMHRAKPTAIADVEFAITGVKSPRTNRIGTILRFSPCPCSFVTGARPSAPPSRCLRSICTFNNGVCRLRAKEGERYK